MMVWIILIISAIYFLYLVIKRTKKYKKTIVTLLFIVWLYWGGDIGLKSITDGMTWLAVPNGFSPITWWITVTCVAIFLAINFIVTKDFCENLEYFIDFILCIPRKIYSGIVYMQSWKKRDTCTLRIRTYLSKLHLRKR